jgi:hypothetical protein
MREMFEYYWEAFKKIFQKKEKRNPQREARQETEAPGST